MVNQMSEGAISESPGNDTPFWRRHLRALAVLAVLVMLGTGVLVVTSLASDNEVVTSGATITTVSAPVSSTTTSSTSSSTTAPEAGGSPDLAEAAAPSGQAGWSPGSASSTTRFPAGGGQTKFTEPEPTPDGYTFYCNDELLTVNFLPTLAQAERLCTEHVQSKVPPAPPTTPAPPLRIERHDWPQGIGGAIGGANMPPEQVTCTLTWYLTLSDGRVITRYREFPLAGLAPGEHKVTWDQDPEFGTYPQPKTYTYIYGLAGDGINIGFLLC